MSLEVLLIYNYKTNCSVKLQDLFNQYNIYITHERKFCRLKKKLRKY